jgi:cytochrome c oxidase cbb3-type subunit 3
MKHGVLAIAAILAITSSCGVPGSRSVDSPVISPAQLSDFPLLYAQNCAGCHGKNGQGGLSVALGDPVYLAIASDATIRRVASEGRPGTAMTAFAQANGGMLTDAQINIIVNGIRSRWGKPGILGDAKPPAYAAPAASDTKHGQMVFNASCSGCHGVNGSGGPAGSLVDGSFLALVSDQYLRTTVITGRPALGMPDWRHRVPKPLADEDVTDVVAWLAAQRPASAGQQQYTTELNAPGGS